MTTASPAAKNHPPATVYSENDIKAVKLDDIFADYDWNSRSKANVESQVTASSESNEGTGLMGLVAGILRDGQDEPVVIRPIEGGKSLGGKSTSKPFELVAGFRRFEAFTRIQNDKTLRDARGSDPLVKNVPNGAIRAVVKSLTVAQARSLNLRENTNRSDMTTPDLVFGVRDMSFNHKIASADIAADLGISNSYCTKLVKIATIQRKILEHWRLGGEFEGVPSAKAVTVEDMTELANVTADRQIEKYKELIVGRGAPKEDNQRIEACKKRAENLGSVLGKLARAGFLTIAKSADWTDPAVVELFTKHGKAGLNKRQTTKCMKAASDAFVNAKEAEETEEEDDSN